METVAAVLGESAATLIELVSKRAQDNGLPLFLAGGVVRDLLLERRNLDLDFVVEGDAIALANSLADDFGGVVRSHPPFGTAKWILDASVEDNMPRAEDFADAQIDFAIARQESYESPAALPTVVSSTIDHDLARRDFTVNALALQLSPLSSRGLIVDPYGGKDDVDKGLIRVMHERSFIDDPTRIFRALRFAGRLDFEIARHSRDLLMAAVPTLVRLSGERIRNEIQLILCESEPERIVLHLQSCGAFEAIESPWHTSEQLPVYFAQCRESLPPWSTADYDMTGLYWHLLMAEISEDVANAVCDHLALTRALTHSITTFARLLSRSEALRDPSVRPSHVTRLLDKSPVVAMHALWICVFDSPLAKQRIESFISDWQNLRPQTDGNELIRLGLQPGPCFRRILGTLRDAWIDGEVRSEPEERKLLQKLLSGLAETGIDKT